MSGALLKTIRSFSQRESISKLGLYKNYHLRRITEKTKVQDVKWNHSEVNQSLELERK